LRYGDPLIEVPKVVKELRVSQLFYNEDYEAYAKERDREVRRRLKSLGVETMAYKDQVIFAGQEIMKGDGTPYKVFSAYKKIWLKSLNVKKLGPHKERGQFVRKGDLKGVSQSVTLKELGFQPADFFYDFQRPGRKSGLKSLQGFLRSTEDYGKLRDFPGVEGTSGLSVHLRFGTLSIRECVRAALKSRSMGSQTWLSELIWRDFYFMILDQFPYVESGPFKKELTGLKWSRSQRNFKAWCKGETGFPIVDAGMRQLNETGWMHNRVRMIVASFLVKDLLIDWRKGERYFAEKLLDFDLAANNGGWQWCASTGCDAQPYFRIFNPENQEKKFDPQREYIREWVPELREGSEKRSDYPAPIVSHTNQRALALKLFKGAKG
jgi:deoxyribodipyrimidine photo-lyase